MAKKPKTEEKTIELSGRQVIESYRGEQAKLDALQRALETIRLNIREINATKDALKEIKEGKKGDKILVLLGSGVFAEATLENNSRVKQNIGSNVVIEQSVGKALENLESMRIEQEKNFEMLQQEQNKAVAKLRGLGTILEAAEQARGEQKKQAKK